MSAGHLPVLFREMSIQVLFLNWTVWILGVLSFISSLQILDINPLADVSVNTDVLPFSQLSFYFVIVPFAVQNLASFM